MPVFPQGLARRFGAISGLNCQSGIRNVSGRNNARYAITLCYAFLSFLLELSYYEGAAVEVLEGLDGQLLVRHEGRILAAQEAPPSPVFLRNGHRRSASVAVPPSGAHGLGERWIEALEPLHSRAEDENDPSMVIDDVATAGRPAATSARKPIFLQKERWKAIQKARRKGMSLRAIERELGIHRSTINKYLDAEGPPTRQCRVVSSTSSSDTIQA